MRTLFDIIEAAKSGAETTHEECLYALLAVESLRVFDAMDLMKIAQNERDGKRVMAQFRWEESFNRSKRALDKSPQEWLGWSNDPKNPEYQKRRTMAVRLFEKVAHKGEQ